MHIHVYVCAHPHVCVRACGQQSFCIKIIHVVFFSLTLLLLHIYDHLPVLTQWSSVLWYQDYDNSAQQATTPYITTRRQSPQGGKCIVWPSDSCLMRYTCPLVLQVLKKDHSLHVICTFQCDNFRHLMWFCIKYNPYLSPGSAFVFKDNNLLTSISLSAAGVFSFPLQVHETHPLKR